MDRDAWIEGRILWKARQHGLPGGRTRLFDDLPEDLRERFAAVAAERGGGRPVLAFVDSDERWTLVGTQKALSRHGGKMHECRLDGLSAVGPSDDCPPGATAEQVGEWKESWEYLRVREGSGAAAELWVPCGGQAYALWNILRMFPGVCRSAEQR